MATEELHMHPDENRDIVRPADLLLTDPEEFTVTGVLRVQGTTKTPVRPGDSDYPFEDDDSNTQVTGVAEDKEKKPHPKRFRKQTPKLKGQGQKDGLSGNDYELEWKGKPTGRGPHFKVFP